MIRIKQRVFIASIFLLLQSCGLKEAKYKKYDAEEDEPLSESCQAALSSFESEVNPGLANCASSSCHARTPIAGATIKLDQPAKNRLILLAYDNGENGQNLYNKITLSNGLSHGGGDRSNDLSKTQIDKWQIKEAVCDP